MEENKWRYLVDKLVGYIGGAEIHYVEIGGPSGVAKPTTTADGSRLCSMSIAIEDNTGDVYFYNESNGWVKQFSFQS